jgi:hypothetical protein
MRRRRGRAAAAWFISVSRRIRRCSMKARVEIHHADPTLGFERFVREIHRVIEDCGPGTVYIFDSSVVWQTYGFPTRHSEISSCSPARGSGTCRRSLISPSSATAIRSMPPTDPRHHPVFLDVFTLDGAFYIRPVKVQYRSKNVMDTLHVEHEGVFTAGRGKHHAGAHPIHHPLAAPAARPHSGYWDRFDQETRPACSMNRRPAGRRERPRFC